MDEVDADEALLLEQLGMPGAAIEGVLRVHLVDHRYRGCHLDELRGHLEPEKPPNARQTGEAQQGAPHDQRLHVQVDAAGDVGNRAQIEAVYAAFQAAVADALAAFGEFR